MSKQAFQFERKKQYLSNLFECFWIILCFLIVVSLHMMPLRAISQEVRVQPNCSNSLFNIKKHRTNENGVFEVFCVFWMLFCCTWCRCVQSHRRYEFNHIVQIIYLLSKRTKKWKRMRKHVSQFKHKTMIPQSVQMFLKHFVFFECCFVANDAVACNLTEGTSSTTLFK